MSVCYITSVRDMKHNRGIRLEKKKKDRSNRVSKRSVSKDNTINKTLMERSSQRHKTQEKFDNITILPYKKKSDTRTDDHSSIVQKTVSKRDEVYSNGHII